jgi:hypothetical protein
LVSFWEVPDLEKIVFFQASLQAAKKFIVTSRFMYLMPFATLGVALCQFACRHSPIKWLRSQKTIQAYFKRLRLGGVKADYYRRGGFI